VKLCRARTYSASTVQPITRTVASLAGGGEEHWTQSCCAKTQSYTHKIVVKSVVHHHPLHVVFHCLCLSDKTPQGAMPKTPLGQFRIRVSASLAEFLEMPRCIWRIHEIHNDKGAPRILLAKHIYRLMWSDIVKLFCTQVSTKRQFRLKC